jgi:hypothetical protein
VPTPTEVEYRFTCEAAPVQAEGVIDGRPFYFRARHEEWTFSVAEQPGLHPADIDSSEAAAGRGFFIGERYGGSRSFAAGHMPLDEARRLIVGCAHAYRAARTA